MAPLPPDGLPEKLQSWLLYYQDIGIRTFYRDRLSPAGYAPPGAPEAPAAMSAAATKTPASPKPLPSTGAAPAPPAQLTPPPTPATRLHGIVQGPSLFEAAARVEGDTLARICSDLG